MTDLKQATSDWLPWQCTLFPLWKIPGSVPQPTRRHRGEGATGREKQTLGYAEDTVTAYTRLMASLKKLKKKKKR